MQSGRGVVCERDAAGGRCAVENCGREIILVGMGVERGASKDAAGRLALLIVGEMRIVVMHGGVQIKRGV